MSHIYDCDACGERRCCCTYRDTPHGDGWFCHRCRGEEDDECDECHEAAREEPRDEAYERAAARYDGRGKDWR